MHGLLHALLEASGLQGVSLAALLAADVLALVTTPSVLRSRRGRPSKALAWLLAIWVFPFVGVLAWWSIGRLRVRRPRQLRERPCAPPLVSAAPPVLTDRVPSAWWQSGEMLPPCGGNRVELLADRLAFEAMAEAIEGAQRSIDALFYIWKDDETGRRLLARLAARARAGVEVRLLVDAVGSPAFRRDFGAELVEAGGQVASFLPVRLARLHSVHFRNHRKVLVVDGSHALTGGMNVGDEYARHWHDLVTRVRGPAAGQLRDVFREDWYCCTGEHLGRLPAPVEGDAEVAVVPSGPDRELVCAHDLLFQTLASARRRAWLMTPYFIPSASVSTALRVAARRGIDVRLLLPARSDVPLAAWASRPFLPELQRAGVGVALHVGEVLHGKALLVDDVAVVGSFNMDSRSFRLNFETLCVIRSADYCASLERLFEADFARASAPRAEPSVLQDVAQLLSPLL